MLNSFNFLKAAVKNQKSLGAVAQSSRFLINKIMESIDLRNAKVIVELGAGVGNITKIIARNANSDARIFCFEINRDFCRQIRRNVPDKRVVIINASAEEMKEYLKKFDIEKADVLISTLPFFNFSLEKKEKILSGISELIENKGVFVLSQYTNKLNTVLCHYFNNIKKKRIILNIPPAIVYVCRN